MRKCILALVALLSLTSAGYAAFAIFQTYSVPAVPQITYNIVTDGGAVCSDNHVIVTRTTSINSGTAILNVTVNTFAPSDVGKAIFVPGAGGSGGVLQTTILSYASAQQITLAANAATTLSSVSTAITYGNDDAPNFKTFNTWARANQGSSQVVLTIPSGSNCWFGTAQTISGTSILNAWASGINNLIVEGAGATINSNDGFGFQLGTTGVCQAGLASASGCSARIQTVSAGASQIALTAASLAAGYISRFTVDRWIMIGGIDTQGIWATPYGFPPNMTRFEWRKITGVNAGTGVIDLDRPLTNTYLSTWPNWNSGNDFEADNGGPATIWTVGGASNSWNASFEYRGLTIDQGGSQTYALGRTVIYRNVTIGGVHGAIPTQNETWAAYDSDFSSVNMETDKLVGTMILDNTTIDKVTVQSSSMDSLVANNATFTSFLIGTPTSATLTDSTFGIFRPGATAYGATLGTVVCTRCAITDFQTDGTLLQNRAADYSMSSGVISFLNTDGSGSDPDQRVFIPGGNIFWGATGYLSVGLFQAQAITQDATNTFIQTNEAGGFPTLTGIPQFRPHPAPQWTCDACTGDFHATATNIQNGATPLAPLGSYYHGSFAPTSAQGYLSSGFKNKGKLTSLTIDVTQAYSGSGAATLQATGQFNNLNMDQSTWTQYDWFPVNINLKQTGTRVITPSGVTCNGSPGACSGDSITTPPSTMWINDGISPFMGSTLGVGTQPLVTVTLRTDQGVVP